MADIKISELSNATNLNDSDILAGVNSGTTRKFQLSRIRDFFKTTFDGAYAAVSHDHNRLYNGSYQASMPSVNRNVTLATQDDLTGTGISYDHTSSGLQAENVQNAIDEVNTKHDTLSGAVTDMQTAVGLNTLHRQNQSNPHGTTAQQVGAIPTEDKGAVNGVASLGANGYVPDTQLPTYVNSVTFTVENETTLVLTATTSR